MNLWQITANIQALLDDLEEGEVDDVTDRLLDQLTEDFTDKARCLIQYIDGLDCEEQAVSKHLERLAKRKRSLRNKRSRLKQYLATCMHVAGTRKLDVGTHKLSLAKSPGRVMLTCETDIPDAYIRTKTEIDKASLKADLKDGKKIPGAILVAEPDVVRVT